MSTKNLLEQVVIIAGEEVKPLIGTVEQIADQLEETSPDLLTESETEMLKVSRAVKKTAPLINLHTAIGAGGIGGDKLPLLALATYQASMEGYNTSVIVQADGSLSYDSLEGSSQVTIADFPPDTLPRVKGLKGVIKYPIEGETTVPLIPLELRQKDAQGLMVLYEANGWQKIVRTVDPYLLRHIAGYIYAVLGTWDITKKELEAFQVARDLGL